MQLLIKVFSRNHGQSQAMRPPYVPTCANAADASNFDHFPPQALPDPEELLRASHNKTFKMIRRSKKSVISIC